MESAAIVPDGYLLLALPLLPVSCKAGLTDVVLTEPFETTLQVMVISDGFPQELQHLLRLFGIEFVDVLRQRSHGVDALPACNRVGSYNGMYRCELLANVQGIPTGTLEYAIMLEECSVCHECGGQSL